VPIMQPADVEDVIELFRLSYERATHARRAPAAARTGEPDA
jgi:hypothetical protein